MPLSIKDRALDDLVQAFRVGVEQFGREQAIAYEDGLYATFSMLAAHPFAFRLRREFTQPIRACRFKAHMIFYTVTVDETVLILRVRHGREDWISDPLEG